MKASDITKPTVELKSSDSVQYRNKIILHCCLFCQPTQ